MLHKIIIAVLAVLITLPVAADSFRLRSGKLLYTGMHETELYRLVGPLKRHVTEGSVYNKRKRNWAIREWLQYRLKNKDVYIWLENGKIAEIEARR